MPKAASASSEFVEAATAERDQLAAGLAEVQERVEHFETLAAEAREEAKVLGDSIRAIEEVAGLADGDVRDLRGVARRAAARGRA